MTDEQSPSTYVVGKIEFENINDEIKSLKFHMAGVDNVLMEHSYYVRSHHDTLWLVLISVAALAASIYIIDKRMLRNV